MQVEINQLQIAWVIPCLNEEATIAQVVAEARCALPQARIVVVDNGSEDATACRAQEAGAEVLHCARRGKGVAYREAFARIEADIYLTIDGDATYGLEAVSEHLQTFVSGHYDLLVGNRLQAQSAHARTGHYWGNQQFAKIMSQMFERPIQDPFSGYRIMSRRFVHSFPSVANGFEVETEMTVHAMDLDLNWIEVPIEYRSRPEDSQSKLNTYRDGSKILLKLLGLYQMKKPLTFYGSLSLVLAFISSLLFLLPLIDFINTGEVARFPTLIVSMSGFVMALLMLLLAIVLHNNNRNTREIKRFLFRSQPYLRQ